MAAKWLKRDGSPPPSQTTSTPLTTPQINGGGSVGPLVGQGSTSLGSSVRTGTAPHSAAITLLDDEVAGIKAYNDSLTSKEQWRQVYQGLNTAKRSLAWGGGAAVVALFIVLIIRPGFIYTYDTEFETLSISASTVAGMTLMTGLISVVISFMHFHRAS